MSVDHFKFTAEPHGSSWMPLGRNANGDEVWCDGCCISDRRLAERIALNMEAAYNKGLEVATRAQIQHGIEFLEKGERGLYRGRISNTTTFGGYVIEDARRHVPKRRLSHETEESICPSCGQIDCKGHPG